MINKLRTATEELHREIEKENLARLIMSHKIELEEYKLLLLQNYVAYKITEAEIAGFLPDFKQVKSNHLEQDLKNFNIDTTIEPSLAEEFKINSRADAYGAAYVVEGSALGGMMISKELKNCGNLSGIKEQQFFNGDRQNVNGWNRFLKELRNTEFSAEEETLAVEKAKETFNFFGKVFREVRLQEKIR